VLLKKYSKDFVNIIVRQMIVLVGNALDVKESLAKNRLIFIILNNINKLK